MAAFMPGNQPRRNPFGAPGGAPPAPGGQGAPMQGGAPPAPAQPAPRQDAFGDGGGAAAQPNNGASAAPAPGQVGKQIPPGATPAGGGGMLGSPQGGGQAPSLANKTGGFLGGAGSGGAGGAGNLAQRAMAGRQADANQAGGKGGGGNFKETLYAQDPGAQTQSGNVGQLQAALQQKLSQGGGVNQSTQDTQGGGALGNMYTGFAGGGNQGAANAAGGKGGGGTPVGGAPTAPQGGGYQEAPTTTTGYQNEPRAGGGGYMTGAIQPQAGGIQAGGGPIQTQGPQETGIQDNQGAANAAGGKGPQPPQTVNQGESVGAPAPPRPAIGQNRLRATR